MGRHVNYSGLVIAGIGFFLTRFTVTLAVDQPPVRFYLAGVVPLTLGLGLAAFGVALTVADVEASLSRTTAIWCVFGLATMFVLVVLTLLGSSTGEMPAFETIRSRTYLANFLIGGSIGGTLTGLYASRNSHQRTQLQQQTNRLKVLNRLLRHEILNAVTAIRGYAALREQSERDAGAVIESRTDEIEATIEEVKYLTENTGPEDAAVGPTDVEECLDAAVDIVTERHPDATVSTAVEGEDRYVFANNRLRRVFTHLLENAIVHSGASAPAVEVTVSATVNDVVVKVADEGPGLPASQQSLLETGDIESFDNPGTGFGLNVVRLLVESYSGRIDTEVEDTGTTVTVALPRIRSPESDSGRLSTRPGSVRPAMPELTVILAASLLAGVVYGAGSILQGGSVSIIGVFYGVQSTVVGWITHEFHSVVFGFVFAGLISIAPERYRNSLPAYVAIGVGWGLIVWFVAAGLISAIWLRLLGTPAPIPNLSMPILVNHVVWGVSLGALTALGYRYVTPWLARTFDRIR